MIATFLLPLFLGMFEIDVPRKTPIHYPQGTYYCLSQPASESIVQALVSYGLSAANKQYSFLYQGGICSNTRVELKGEYNNVTWETTRINSRGLTQSLRVIEFFEFGNATPLYLIDIQPNESVFPTIP